MQYSRLEKLTFVLFKSNYLIHKSVSNTFQELLQLLMKYTVFYKQHFSKQRQAEMNAKQYTEAEFFLLENYSHSSAMLSSKNYRTYSRT